MTDAWTTGYDAGEREMARLVLVRCTAAGTTMLHESVPLHSLSSGASELCVVMDKGGLWLARSVCGK